MARKIEVVNYDPQWPKMFHAEAKEIRRILGKNCVAIHHIGSTAVKDMKAKPTIDIMPVVKSMEQVDALNPQFEALGYECMGEYGIAGRRYYCKGGDHHTHHIHIFEQSNTEAIQRHLAMVEYLSGNEQKREEYSQMKTYLAEAYPEDPEGYSEGKAYYVAQLEQEALHQASQPQEEEETGGKRSVGLSIGIGAGLILGLTVFDNIGIGLCVGMGVGAIIQLILSRKNNAD